MSLQRLIDDASPGAVIDVPSGLHLARLVIRKPLTLRGEDGATLDASGQGPVVTIDVWPGPAVRLVNLTLRNGAAQAGGGVQISTGIVELERCVVSGNHAAGFGGGGVYSSGQRLVIDRCRIEDNRGRQGGGLFLDGAVEATVRDSLIARNAGYWGGGVRVREGAQLRLERCTVAHNVVVGEGAAGTQLHVTGTTTRAPSLTLQDTIVVGADAAPAVVNGPELPGAIAGARVLAGRGELPAAVTNQLHGAPEFSGAEDAPFRPGSKSAAAGAGDAAGIPDDATDLAGRPRKRSGHLDLGAYSLVP